MAEENRTRKGKMRHSQEFMQNAINHYFANGMNALATGKKFGVTDCTIKNWVKKADELDITLPERMPEKSAKHTFYTREFMQEVLDFCFANGGNKKAAAKRYKVSQSSILYWIRNHVHFGLKVAANAPKNTWKKPEALRREAVEWYFANGMSASETGKRFGNVAKETVIRWVRRYATTEQLKRFDEYLKPKYSDELREKVVAYYNETGESITNVCKHFSLPFNTVKQWIAKENRDKVYTDELRDKVLQHYYTSGMDAQATAKHFGIHSYRTVSKWVSFSDPSKYLEDKKYEIRDIRNETGLDSLEAYTYEFILTVLRYYLMSVEDGGAGKDAVKTCMEFGLPPETFNFILRKYGFPMSLRELKEIDRTHKAVENERRFGKYSERFRTRVFEYYFSPNCRCDAKTAAQYFGIDEKTVRLWFEKYGCPRTIEEMRVNIQARAEQNADAKVRRANETSEPYPIDFIVGALKFYYEHGHNRKLVLAHFGIGAPLLQSWLERYGDYEALRQYREKQENADPYFRGKGYLGFSDEFVKEVVKFYQDTKSGKGITYKDVAAKFGISIDSVRRIIRNYRYTE